MKVWPGKFFLWHSTTQPRSGLNIDNSVKLLRGRSHITSGYVPNSLDGY